MKSCTSLTGQQKVQNYVNIGVEAWTAQALNYVSCSVAGSSILVVLTLVKQVTYSLKWFTTKIPSFGNNNYPKRLFCFLRKFQWKLSLNNTARQYLWPVFLVSSKRKFCCLCRTFKVYRGIFERCPYHLIESVATYSEEVWEDKEWCCVATNTIFRT